MRRINWIRDKMEVGTYIHEADIKKGERYTFVQFDDCVGVTYYDLEGGGYCNCIEIYGEDKLEIATSPYLAIDFNIILGAINAWKKCRQSVS